MIFDRNENPLHLKNYYEQTSAYYILKICLVFTNYLRIIFIIGKHTYASACIIFSGLRQWKSTCICFLYYYQCFVVLFTVNFKRLKQTKKIYFWYFYNKTILFYNFLKFCKSKKYTKQDFYELLTTKRFKIVPSSTDNWLKFDLWYFIKIIVSTYNFWGVLNQILSLNAENSKSCKK